MVTFIDFISSASEKPSLGREFVRIIKDATPEKLSEWFRSNFGDISIDECKRLLKNKSSFTNISKFLPGPY